MPKKAPPDPSELCVAYPKIPPGQHGNVTTIRSIKMVFYALIIGFQGTLMTRGMRSIRFIAIAAKLQYSAFLASIYASVSHVFGVGEKQRPNFNHVLPS